MLRTVKLSEENLMPLLCKAQKMTKLIKFKLRWIIMKLKIEEKKVILVWWKLFKANT